jgi:hypothetical protein
VSTRQTFSGWRGVHRKSKLGIGFFSSYSFGKFRRDSNDPDQTHEALLFYFCEKVMSLRLSLPKSVRRNYPLFALKLTSAVRQVFLCTLCIKILIPMHIAGAMLESPVHGESGKFSGRHVAPNEAS